MAEQMYKKKPEPPQENAPTEGEVVDAEVVDA